MIRVRHSDTQILLPVRVTPRGGKNCLLPFSAGDDTLKIKVSVPPEDGKANVAVLKLLAETLGIPKGRLQVAAGEKSRNKQIAILLSASAEAETLLQTLARSIGADGADCFCRVSLLNPG